MYVRLNDCRETKKNMVMTENEKKIINITFIVHLRVCVCVCVVVVIVVNVCPGPGNNERRKIIVRQAKLEDRKRDRNRKS